MYLLYLIIFVLSPFYVGIQVLHTMSNSSIARASVGRSIPSAPLRILDAPDLVDDYYLNLISWGHNNVRGWIIISSLSDRCNTQRVMLCDG